MPTKIILKKSSITGRIPDQSTLDYGELALNYTDGVLYYKNSANIVKSISAGLDSDLTLQLMESSYAAINTSLIPSADSTYDLGTPTKKWKELYLSGNTIHLGETKLSADGDGNVSVRDNFGQLKKLVVDEIEVGVGANKVKLKGNNGKLRVDNTSDAQQKLDFSLNTTSDLAEGSNLYHTSARVTGLITPAYIQARQIRGADSSWVTDQINDLIDAAPGALDTLAELASAIGDDANFSTTITNLIATMPDSAYVASYVSSQLPRYGTDYVDSSYVSSVLPRYGTDYVDSSWVTGYVTSQNYITGYTVTQSDVTNHQAALSITESQISDFGTYATTASLATVATSGRYSDLTGKPTTISGYGITDAFDGNYNSLTNKPSLFSGSYNDLSNKPTIPTNNNQLTNGAGYITNVSAVDAAYVQARQIRGADSSWVSSEITSAVDDLINGAPEAVNTLNELAIAYADADSDLQTLISNNGTRLTTAESEIDTLQSWGNHADAGYITDYTVTQSDVTQHQAALSITESQISDLVHYADSDVRVLVDSSYVNDRVTITENQISSVVDSDYILSRSTSVEIYDAYDSFISRHQLKLKADTQNGHVVVIGQILVEDSQGANSTLRDVSFHSPLEETMISINTLKATVAASTDFADFQARIAAL